MGLRRILLESAGVFPRPELPLIVFGCEFVSDANRQIGRCKACGLEGKAMDTLVCKLASTWALGKGHFKYAHQGDDYF